MKVSFVRFVYAQKFKLTKLTDMSMALFLQNTTREMTSSDFNQRASDLLYCNGPRISVPGYHQ